MEICKSLGTFILKNGYCAFNYTKPLKIINNSHNKVEAGGNQKHKGVEYRSCTFFGKLLCFEMTVNYKSVIYFVKNNEKLQVGYVKCYEKRKIS